MNLTTVIAAFAVVSIFFALVNVVLKTLSILVSLRRYAMRAAIAASLGAGGIGGIAAEDATGTGRKIVSEMSRIITGKGGRPTPENAPQRSEE